MAKFKIIKETIESELKKFDVSKVKKPWSIISDGKPLSRNSIYIGEVLPDFLMEKYQKPIYILTRPDGTVVDDKVRQKVKKTIIKELIKLNYKYEPQIRFVMDVTKIIKNVPVRIKWITGKGYAIVIDHRKSTDIDKDTLKVCAFLEKKGIMIKDEAICPTYCIPKRETVLEE